MSAHFRFMLAGMALALVAGGCSQMPGTGPRTDEVVQGGSGAAADLVQIVDLDDAVARRLLSQRHQRLFSDTLGSAPVKADEHVGPGDAIQVTIWETPPATLFGTSQGPLGATSAAQSTPLPDQVVDGEGFIVVPFAGRIHVAGSTPQAVASEIAQRLKGKANHPEVLVRITGNRSAIVTVVGEVNASVRMPLTPSGERLLDALAAAGGVRQPVNKVSVQVTRGDQFQALPLDLVIRDPRQNVPLKAGDVVTALFQPLSFTALGATGRQEEINFEAQGINLAQALARAGGLVDNRSDTQGVFIFRFEPANALDWPRKPAAITPEGLVPVIYRVDLRDPRSFFVMQSFALNNKDLIYISNAPVAELQKFLNVVFSGIYPLVNLIRVTQ